MLHIRATTSSSINPIGGGRCGGAVVTFVATVLTVADDRKNCHKEM